MSTLAQTDSAELPESDTLSERAAGLVERDIIAGLHAPGARLGISDLVQRYEIGATPLREGLSRLISRGLIVGIGQRGFRVADVSREDLLDITRMRTVVEVEALRLAIAQGDDAWEAGILSALHQMRRHIQRTGNEFREGAPDFDRLHKAFHTSLLTAEPFVTRMTNAGLGTVGARYGAELARTEPIIFYAAARDWAEKNPDVIKKFRDAIAEGAAIVNTDRDKTSASISKFTKQPIELVKTTMPNRSEPALRAEQLAWWIDIMSSQKMLQTKVDLNKLMLN